MEPIATVTATSGAASAEGKKKKIRQTLNMAGGFIAGTMATVATAEATGTISVYDLLETNKPQDTIDATNVAQAGIALTDVPVANNISNNLSFNEAYEQARQQLGAGGIFTWHGEAFNTYTANEWNALSVDERNQFVNNADIENLDIPDYDPPPPPEVVTHHEAPTHHHHEAAAPTVTAHSNHGNDTDIYESLLLDDDKIHTTENSHETELINVPDVPAVQGPEDVEIDTSFDAAPVVTVGEKLNTPADASGAPMADGYLVEVDGKADAVGVDQNHDGKLEVVVVDGDNDGKIETLYYSSTNDNVMDVIVHDDNQDGEPDSVDPLGEAPKDDFSFDTPNPDEFDPNANVESWK